MGFQVGKLRLLDLGELVQQELFIVLFLPVHGIEKLYDLKVFIGGAPLNIELKMPLFRLFKGTNELE